MLKISFASALPTEQALLLTVAEGQKLGTEGQMLDKKLESALSRAMSHTSFTGAKEQTLTIMAPTGSKFSRIVLVGIGDPAKADEKLFQRAGSAGCVALNGKDSTACFAVDDHKGVAVTGAAAQVAFGFQLRAYRFDKYRTKLKPEQKPHLKNLVMVSVDSAKAKQLYAKLEKVAEGVFLTRDLVSEPANVIYPESFAAQCKALEVLGLKVDVLDEKQMKKLGMGALLGVAQGSVRPPRLVTMTWHGNPSAKDKRPVVFVGKGVTFDSGGLSLKPPAGMEEMKWDMAGAGAVIGVMKALAGRKAKANIIGVVGLVENMPSGNAQRPGDIVTSMSGQTIEVLNTDAEGRLVLADALWYAQEKFKPRVVVNLATLTGAIITALGHEYAGLFCNNDALATQLTAAGQQAEELLWRFPLCEAFDKDIDCAIADMRNIGTKGEAGSITAAQFLQRYIQKDVAWAHLDIAGTAWQHKDRPLTPKGATAFGVRLLDQFVADLCE